MKSLSELLEEAQALPDRRRPAWAKYNEIVGTLRNKGMSYREIFQWLVDRGQPLAESDYRRFLSSASTNQSWAVKSATKAAAKVKQRR